LPTQKAIAEHLDMSQQQVKEMLEKLNLPADSPLDSVRVAYIRRLREQAAGRYSEGPLDLVNERARLAKEQADRLEMQNAVTRKEMAPVIIIENVLARAGVKVAGILDAIPGMIRRRSKSVSSEDIDCIAEEIIRARNMAAAISLDDFEDESQS
jgi:terminase small subunit / prophage DNA-packing protein